MLYDFNDTRFQKILSFFLDISVLLITFEILSNYSLIDSSYWLQEYNQWIMNKLFREKLMVSNGFDPSSRTSLLSFWFLPDFVVVFIVIRLVAMSYWSPMSDKHPYILYETYMSAIIDLRWNLLILIADKN